VSRVYIHEFVDIAGPNRARYLHHITANWSPIGQQQRRQLCFGVWGVVGSTGRWPQVVNLWEYENWADLAFNFEVELASPTMQDPDLADWWRTAASLRTGGFDRILVAPDWSPGIVQLTEAGARGAGYAHELVKCRPGAARELLESVRELGVAAYAEAGLGLIGAFRRAMVADDELVLIWAFGDWDGWGQFEASTLDTRSPVGDWRSRIAADVVGWERILLVDAELCPLRIGRQPSVEDRRPLDMV
jgi:hypothetical protein